MKEVKTPKKPLAIYYTIVLLLLLLLNVVLVPWMNERQIKEVDYGTFMTMTEEKNIGKVEHRVQPDHLHRQGRHASLQDRPDGRLRT